MREHQIRPPSNIDLIVDGRDVENYWNNYDQGDVLVAPRRYGGLHLPALEALGAGMPVVMTDISPNNTWLPNEWLLPAAHKGAFMVKQRVDYHSADHTALAALIDRLATDQDFYTKAKDDATRLRQELSWDRMRPRYREVLGNV
jgi:glycosyltransferase involved in cell wall biosynthesis